MATPISNRIVLYGILAHADSLWRITRVLQVPTDSLMMLGEDETDENPPPARITNLQVESVDEGAA